MTPDPISRAPESTSDTPLTEFTQDQVKIGTVRTESASDVLRSLEWNDRCTERGYCPWCGSLRMIGHSPDCRLAAALADPTPAPSGDEVAELRVKLRSAEATIAKALDRETQALYRLAAAEARVKTLEEALGRLPNSPTRISLNSRD